MVVLVDTPQQRRDRFLKLAVEAETAAAKVSDPNAKAAWIDFAVSWMMMASDIPRTGESRGSWGANAHKSGNSP
jgi:hypothetical protein